MTVNITNYSNFLKNVANEIDIPPGKYQEAVDRYQAVSRWLEDGEYPGCPGAPSIYPQGSFRLGTVVRPIRNGVEASYDIDLVCEIPFQKDHSTPSKIKSTVGNRLQEHGNFRRLLAPEGRRCWTLEYAEQDGVGFHLDVLPAVLDGRKFYSTSNALAITSKNGSAYSWSASDPRGYGKWFDTKNRAAFALVVVEQKRNIQRCAPRIYASIDKVPDQLVRTPLQHSIQLMKRHRDLRFNHHDLIDYAPISIIITTLAAHLYGNETDVYFALCRIVDKLQAHAALVEGKAIDRSLSKMGLIQRTLDSKWYIGNPVNPDENFADRWHEDDHVRARAFFVWVDALQKDLLDIPGETNLDQIKKHLGRVFGRPARVHITSPTKPWREA